MDAAVYGVPEKVLGEEVVCSVQLKPNHSNVTAEHIIAHCRKQMAAFKVPIYVDIRHEPLPRNANGKIVKRDLKEEITPIVEKMRAAINKSKL